MLTITNYKKNDIDFLIIILVSEYESENKIIEIADTKERTEKRAINESDDESVEPKQKINKNNEPKKEDAQKLTKSKDPFKNLKYIIKFVYYILDSYSKLMFLSK